MEVDRYVYHVVVYRLVVTLPVGGQYTGSFACLGIDARRVDLHNVFDAARGRTGVAWRAARVPRATRVPDGVAADVKGGAVVSQPAVGSCQTLIQRVVAEDSASEVGHERKTF